MKKLFILLVALSSCRELPITQTITTTKDSTSTRKVEKQIKVEGSTVISPDVMALIAQMQAQRAQQIIVPGQPPQTIYRTVKDDNGVELKFALDENGKLRAECSKRDSMFTFLMDEVEHWHKMYEKTTVTVYEKSWYEKLNLWEKIGVIAAGVITLAIILVALAYKWLRG